MKKLLLAFLCFISFYSSAQDISGSWEGNYSGFLSLMNPQKLVVDIMLHNDSIVTGSSHLYYGNGKYEHYTIRGKYHPNTGSIEFVEDSTLAVNIDHCLGRYTMKLKVNDSIMRFEGRWKDKSEDFVIFRCPSTNVWLQRKTIPKKKQQIAPKHDKKLDRIAVVQKLIELQDEEKDSIKIDLLDNAEIDGDIVSIYFNDSLIVKKQRISDKPVTFYLSVKKSQGLCKLKMIAESEGSIPPCTALMIVSTNHKRYEINLSSDYTNNAVLEFFLKE